MPLEQVKTGEHGRNAGLIKSVMLRHTGMGNLYSIREPRALFPFSFQGASYQDPGPPHTSGLVKYYYLLYTIYSNISPCNRSFTIHHVAILLKDPVTDVTCAVINTTANLHTYAGRVLRPGPAYAGSRQKIPGRDDETRCYGSRRVIVMVRLAAFQDTSLPNDLETTRRGTIMRLFLIYGAASRATTSLLMTAIAVPI